MDVAIVAHMETDAHLALSHTFTTGVTITIRANLAGAGWEDAFGAEVSLSASSTGTRASPGQVMISLVELEFTSLLLSLKLDSNIYQLTISQQIKF